MNQKIVETENKKCACGLQPNQCNAFVLSPGAEPNLPLGMSFRRTFVDADLSRYLVILRRENFWSSEGKRIYFETTNISDESIQLRYVKEAKNRAWNDERAAG